MSHPEEHRSEAPFSDTDHQIAMNIHRLGLYGAGQVIGRGPQSKANERSSLQLSWWIG